MLLEDVFVEYLHRVKYTGDRTACDPSLTALQMRIRVIHRWGLLCAFAAAMALPSSARAQQPTDTVQVPPAPRDTVTNPTVRIRLNSDSLQHLPTVLSRADRESYRRAVAQIEAARATAFQQNMRSIIQAVWGQVAASTFATAEKTPSFAV